MWSCRKDGSRRSLISLIPLIPFIILTHAITNNFVLLDSDLTQKRVIWMSGMQLEGPNGMAEYIANSSTYLDAYLVALESATANAPSLVPVLVVQGSINDALVDDLQALGALVVHHTLSFRHKLEEYTPQLISGLWGSYLRTDIPNIMPKVQRLVDHTTVDTNYVLWTDPDVIFLQDVNSTVLPKPRYIAMGPDASPDHAENGGVIYYNISAYQDVFDDLLQWSERRRFDFEWVDQSMLVGYFNQGGASRITPLPNVFNWCGSRPDHRRMRDHHTQEAILGPSRQQHPVQPAAQHHHRPFPRAKARNGRLCHAAPQGEARCALRGCLVGGRARGTGGGCVWVQEQVCALQHAV